MRRSHPPSDDSRVLVADRLRFLLGTTRTDTGVAVDVEPLPPPRFHRVHVAVVTVLVLVGLLATGWTLLRARPVALPGPAAAVTVSTPPVTGSALATAQASQDAIVVHVAGAVRRPGLVRLSVRSRVQDAIDAAGGLTRDARPGQLNLAQLLTDGQQVLIGTVKHPMTEVRDGGAPPSVRPGSTPSTTIDLNRAAATELEQLPGVGPVTAANIVSWRDQHGRFTSVSELQQVEGIGPKMYARIAPHVRV